MPCFGLQSTDTNTPVPLKSISIKSDIQGFIANVESTLVYRNTESSPIEALFTFPLDDQSAIYRFEAEIEGRLIVGECQDKDEAQKTYQDAVEAGQSAFLMQESVESSDVFECSVGNLPPDTDALIRFAYVIELGLEADGAVKFNIPMVLGGRYGSGIDKPSATPETSGGSVRAPSGSKTIRPSYVAKEKIPYTFSFEADVKSDHKINQVVAADSDDRLSVKFVGKGKKHAKVKLMSKFSFDHDLILFVSYGDTYQPHVITEKGDQEEAGILKEDVVMLNFLPDLATTEPNTKGEYIFIVDRSGSMGGDRMDSAKKALGEFLEILPMDCYFNILSFGSGFQYLFPRGSAKHSKANLAQAKRLKYSMNADMGGTQILEPLRHVYSEPSIDGYPKQLFLLTDGAVWNTQEIIKLAKSHAKTTRMFTFGIGHGASTSLCKGLARAGKGKAEFVTDDVSKLALKVKRTLERSMQPNVNNVNLTIKLPEGLKAITIPSELPAIFMEETLVQYALITGKVKEGAASVVPSATLTGTIGDKPIKFDLEFSLTGEVTTSMPVHRLATKAKIKELQDDEETYQQHKSNIILLSTAANVMSKYTSFVGVDKERPDKIEGEMETRNVPLAEREGKRKKKLAADSSIGGSIKRMRMAAPPAMAPPTMSYGGGSSDSIMAAKHLIQEAMSQLKPAGLKSACRDLEEEWYRVSPMQDILDKETKDTPKMKQDALCNEVPLSDIHPINIEPNKDAGKKHEAELVSMTKVTPKFIVSPAKGYKKRTVKSSMGFTHIKTHSKPTATVEYVFAKWKDNFFYPAKIDSRNGGKEKFDVKFNDGYQVQIKEEAIVKASLLLPGDEIGLRTVKFYSEALVVDYSLDWDRFTVVRRDGVVLRVSVSQIILPWITAQKMRDRETFTLEPKKVCVYPDPKAKYPLVLMTNDLAELIYDGWINDQLVELYLRYLWHECLSPAEAATSMYFPPKFFEILSIDLKGKERFSRQEEKELRFTRVQKWAKQLVFEEKTHVFVPIYEEDHWYLILIEIYKIEEVVPNNRIPSYRVNFSTMDSYYTSGRLEEIRVIQGFLQTLAKIQGVQLNFSDGTNRLNVPVQENDSDCGLCMLQCVEQAFLDDLLPSPTLKWFSSQTLLEKRQLMAKIIMDKRVEQM